MQTYFLSKDNVKNILQSLTTFLFFSQFRSFYIFGSVGWNFVNDV
jgi:hypothetical protein